MPPAPPPPPTPHARRPRALLAAAAAAAALVAAPIAGVLASVLAPGTGEHWRHLASTVLPEYLAATAVLLVAVGAGTTAIGTLTAWLVTAHDFPGRRTFEWALVLPLAVPAYVMAYTYTDLLQFAGPVQGWLRATFGWRRGDYAFPEIRSLGGAAALFVLVLYPYVYLLARTAFLARGTRAAEAARTLGLTRLGAFARVALPLARPAIAAGAALALMETLADYGAVSYFGVQTFTTGIYRAWFSLGDRTAASQLSAGLLGFVVLVLLAERATRGGARYAERGGGPAPREPLRGAAGALAAVACAAPLAGGFLVPGLVLLRMARAGDGAGLSDRFLRLAGHSFTLAAGTAALAVGLAVLVGYAARAAPGRAAGLAGRVVGLGYAVPGSVIAVGVLVPVAGLDRALGALVERLTGAHPGLLLTGGVAALVYALLVRFLAVALQTVEAGLARITPSMEEAARSLGSGDAEVLGRVHLPLLSGALWTAALLVFVDVLKELPATLVMRPFDFDTLATHAYTLASDERLAEAAPAALAIVAVGVLPLVALTRRIAAGRG